MTTNHPLAALRHHVSGAIERGEKQAIAGIPAPVFPAIFTGSNLDEVNYKLRQGYASKAEAEAYVYWWNNSGKRFTTATLRERLVSLNGIGVMAPYITIA